MAPTCTRLWHHSSHLYSLQTPHDQVPDSDITPLTCTHYRLQMTMYQTLTSLLSPVLTTDSTWPCTRLWHHSSHLYSLQTPHDHVPDSDITPLTCTHYRLHMTMYQTLTSLLSPVLTTDSTCPCTRLWHHSSHLYSLQTPHDHVPDSDITPLTCTHYRLHMSMYQTLTSLLSPVLTTDSRWPCTRLWHHSSHLYSLQTPHDHVPDSDITPLTCTHYRLQMTMYQTLTSLLSPVLTTDSTCPCTRLWHHSSHLYSLQTPDDHVPDSDITPLTCTHYRLHMTMYQTLTSLLSPVLTTDSTCPCTRLWHHSSHLYSLQTPDDHVPDSDITPLTCTHYRLQMTMYQTLTSLLSPVLTTDSRWPCTRLWHHSSHLYSLQTPHDHVPDSDITPLTCTHYRLHMTMYQTLTSLLSPVLTTDSTWPCTRLWHHSSHLYSLQTPHDHVPDSDITPLTCTHYRLHMTMYQTLTSLLSPVLTTDSTWPCTRLWHHSSHLYSLQTPDDHVPDSDITPLTCTHYRLHMTMYQTLTSLLSPVLTTDSTCPCTRLWHHSSHLYSLQTPHDHVPDSDITPLTCTHYRLHMTMYQTLTSLLSPVLTTDSTWPCTRLWHHSSHLYSLQTPHDHVPDSDITPLTCTHYRLQMTMYQTLTSLLSPVLTTDSRWPCTRLWHHSSHLYSLQTPHDHVPDSDITPLTCTHYRLQMTMYQTLTSLLSPVLTTDSTWPCTRLWHHSSHLYSLQTPDDHVPDSDITPLTCTHYRLHMTMYQTLTSLLSPVLTTDSTWPCTRLWHHSSHLYSLQTPHDHVPDSDITPLTCTHYRLQMTMYQTLTSLLSPVLTTDSTWPCTRLWHHSSHLY